MKGGRPRGLRVPGEHTAALGPPISTYPISAFSKLRFTEDQFRDAWKVCGATAERNLSQGLQLWQVFTILYLEGMCHGVGIMKERQPVGEFHTLWDQYDVHD
jgi:hypothetical protein